jgi:hypothetical protein
LFNLALNLFRLAAKLQAAQPGDDQPEAFNFRIVRRNLRVLLDHHFLQRRRVQCVQIWQRRDGHVQNMPCFFR